MRIRIAGVGHGLLAAAGAGLAILNVAYRDFAPLSKTLPAWVGWQSAAVVGSAFLLSCASAGLLFAGTALASAIVLGAYLAIWTAARAVPLILQPPSVGSWYGVCEALAPFLGTVILFLQLRRNGAAEHPGSGTRRALGVARALFGLACIVYGLAHFTYDELTASMVPGWLPNRLGFAHFTGIGHMAAGAGIVFGILPRLAATLEAIMMSLFGLIVWLPSFFVQPRPDWAMPPENQWSELVITLLLAASAWIVAKSLENRPWGLTLHAHAATRRAR